MRNFPGCNQTVHEPDRSAPSSSPSEHEHCEHESEHVSAFQDVEHSTNPLLLYSFMRGHRRMVIHVFC